VLLSAFTRSVLRHGKSRSVELIAQLNLSSHLTHRWKAGGSFVFNAGFLNLNGRALCKLQQTNKLSKKAKI
jgi:hypothetical protein